MAPYASSSSQSSSPPSIERDNGLEMHDRKGPHVGEGAIIHDRNEPKEAAFDVDEVDATKSTSADRFQMERMGKDQVFVRHFKPMATFSFVAMATSVWEFGIFSISQGLVDGGRAGLIWSTIVHAVGFIPIVLSMAEMASIAPTAGSQYHWVSEFAHPKVQRLLSYYTGWISTLAWQAGNAIGVFLTGTLIQVIILENNPDYGKTFPNWHGSLLVIANILITVTGNIFLTRYIPRVQTAFFVLHILTFFAVMIPICINAPKASAREVFADFQNLGGWPNMGVALMAGQLSAIYMMCGMDSSCHISEEVRDAAKSVPRSMMSIYVVNVTITLAAWFIICFAMPDVELALEHPSLYPFIQVMEQSMSITWVTVELTLIVALVLFANVCYLTAVSRDLFAFARDGGTPFHQWVAYVHPKYRAPVNAVYVTSAFSFLLSLIYIGSSTAFYAITSLMTVALLQCYMFSISSILWRRIYLPETIPESHFSLGRWGIPINAMAVVWCAWSFFWSFWPQAIPITADGFNWASAIFVGVILVATVHYFVSGHKTYHGPVTLVKRM
ncbi:hypothetical protein B0A48_11059 [Cryoendolithus antarcticus]|uniref:Amino acid permease/ SLC12A domain-containing protein n=1 Tax=Cryoendolithus antarcticus TaxID=1507870 RepID=A0A1V8SUB6_9PEZI|nr:hypothetical protein B0A48_11059 [Cryoendolithus antarcticus]